MSETNHLHDKAIPYGILFATVGTDSDMMATEFTIEVGARARYLLVPGAKERGFFYIIQRLIQYKVRSGN